MVLSEFTGAATELDGAHFCNPHDLESVKRAIMGAVNSLEHHPDDARGPQVFSLLSDDPTRWFSEAERDELATTLRETVVR